MTEHELRKKMGRSRDRLEEVKRMLVRDDIGDVSRYDLMDEHDRLIPEIKALSDAVEELPYSWR